MKRRFPLISIIITTKNEEKNIENCLKSIKLQSYPQEKIEIIVVDNNSIDKTVKLAKNYTNKVFNKGPERSAQRNFGILKKSKGKYTMFLDADMTLSQTAIEKAVNKLENSKIVALYIPEVILGNSFWCQVRRFERNFYDRTVIDGLRFFKRDIFIKSGGFDEKLNAFEDWDLDKRIKKFGKVAILDKYNFEKISKKLNKINYKYPTLLIQLNQLNKKGLIYHHKLGFNFFNYLAKKAYYAGSFKTYLEKWGANDPDIKKQLGLYYRYFGVFTEQSKWKKLLRHPTLAFGMLILKILIGVVYLYSKIPILQ